MTNIFLISTFSGRVSIVDWILNDMTLNINSQKNFMTINVKSTIVHPAQKSGFTFNVFKYNLLH